MWHHAKPDPDTVTVAFRGTPRELWRPVPEVGADLGLEGRVGIRYAMIDGSGGLRAQSTPGRVSIVRVRRDQDVFAGESAAQWLARQPGWLGEDMPAPVWVDDPKPEQPPARDALDELARRLTPGGDRQRTRALLSAAVGEMAAEARAPAVSPGVTGRNGSGAPLLALAAKRRADKAA